MIRILNADESNEPNFITLRNGARTRAVIATTPGYNHRLREQYDQVIIVSTMIAETAFASQIRKLLQSKTVLSLKQIRQALSNRPRSSLFRDLKKLDLITSYTHAGQFHALKSAAHFDANGLWFFEPAGFSKYGTLKNTLTHLISHAPAGMTQ